MIVILILMAFALSFAFAPFPVRFVAYFALIPLISIIPKYNYKKLFGYGFIFGVVFAFFHLWWLYFLYVPLELTTKILLYVGVTILFGYLALYTAVFSVITKFLGIGFAPLVWIVLEFIRTKSEIGFPWGFLGYTQTPYIPIVQLSSIFGIYGLSAWIIWINLLWYWLFKKKHKLTYLIVLILSFTIPIIYGLVRIKKQPDLFKVAIVQPNIPPDEKGDRASRNQFLNELQALVKQASQEKVDMIVLPETATLVDITKSENLSFWLQEIADSNDVYIFTGTPIYDRDKPAYYNGAVLFVPHKGYYDSIINEDSSYIIRRLSFDKIYRKIHLVPFSERIPLRDKISLIRRIETTDMGNSSAGREFTVFDISDSNKTIPNFSALICFEAIFPDLARSFTIRGANMFVNITNDGWFGKTPGPYQHCELAILRSVENGVPLVRSANNGISLVTDVYARIIRQSNLFTQGVLVSSVSAPLPSTFYRKHGDILIFFALGLIFVGFLVKLVRSVLNRR
ncbi:MAG: apolipoprotein N-acyltransferase [candidate division WOR-3 bacterium]